MTRPSWDRYFLGIAAAVGQRADCSRRMVGAVIVDQSRRIVSTGYNGSEPGGLSCLAGACPRASSDVPAGSDYTTGAGRCIAIHAEDNAIRWADRSRLPGSTIYVTADPCPWCARLIEAAGIARVVTAAG